MQTVALIVVEPKHLFLESRYFGFTEQIKIKYNLLNVRGIIKGIKLKGLRTVNLKLQISTNDSEN